MPGPPIRSLADDHGIRATLFSVGRTRRKRTRIFLPIFWVCFRQRFVWSAGAAGVASAAL